MPRFGASKARDGRSYPRRSARGGAGCPRGVDAVTIFEEDTPLALLQAVKPDVLVKGGDYRPSDVIGRELVEAAGGRIEIVPLTPEKSTSSLVERMRASGAAR